MLSHTGRMNLGFIHKSLNNLEVKVKVTYVKLMSIKIKAFYDAQGEEFDGGDDLEFRVHRHVKDNPSSILPKGTKIYKEIMNQKDKNSTGMYDRGGSSRSGL